jgi:hypothetical protein
MRAAALLTALALLWPAAAQACRVPPRPERLQSLEADAIVLVLITDVEVDGGNWRATAVLRGRLMGNVRQREFNIDNGLAGSTVIVTSCDRSWLPKPGRYGIMYLRRTPEGLRLNRIYPYWWARASGDRRLDRLERMLPLGAAREPTADETRLLDLAEPRIELPAGVASLSGYTRVYARSAPGSVSGMLIRARHPRRMIVDDTGELPSAQSCRCRPIPVRAELDDLWRAGRLPPFNP